MFLTPDLQNRLRLLTITDDTKQNLRLFYPVFHQHLPEIVGRFYAHLLTFPAAKRVLGDRDMIDSLKPRQIAHWSHLFSGQIDDEYVANAIRIGQVHYERRVPPYLYIAGYNFFHCEIIKLASENFTKAHELAILLASVTRLISLDMDLALSAYTREYWRGPRHPAEA